MSTKVSTYLYIKCSVLGVFYQTAQSPCSAHTLAHTVTLKEMQRDRGRTLIGEIVTYRSHEGQDEASTLDSGESAQ